MLKRIEGFNIVLDKTPPKWSGSISLASRYKGLSEYVTSSKEDFSEALQEIFSRYNHRDIEGINLNKVKETC